MCAGSRAHDSNRCRFRVPVGGAQMVCQSCKKAIQVAEIEKPCAGLTGTHRPDNRHEPFGNPCPCGMTAIERPRRPQRPGRAMSPVQSADRMPHRQQEACQYTKECPPPPCARRSDVHAMPRSVQRPRTPAPGPRPRRACRDRSRSAGLEGRRDVRQASPGAPALQQQEAGRELSPAHLPSCVHA